MQVWQRWGVPGAPFAIDYPLGWSVRELADQLGVIVSQAPRTPDEADGRFVNTFSALVDPTRAGGQGDLEGFAAGQLAGFEQVLTDFRVVDLSVTDLDATEAMRLLSTARVGVHAITMDTWLAVEAGRGFCLSTASDALERRAMVAVWEEVAGRVQLGDRSAA